MKMKRLHAGQEVRIGQPAFKKIAFMCVALVLTGACVLGFVGGIVGGFGDSPTEGWGERIELILVGLLGALLFGGGTIIYAIRIVAERGFRLFLTRSGVSERFKENGAWQTRWSHDWSDIAEIRLSGDKLRAIILQTEYGPREVSRRYGWSTRLLARLMRRCLREFGQRSF